jgi:hypothetical protein
LFLKVLFSCVGHSEFLVLAHNVPGMMVFEKKNIESSVMFLDCTVMPHTNSVWDGSNMMFLECAIALSCLSW